MQALFVAMIILVALVILVPMIFMLGAFYRAVAATFRTRNGAPEGQPQPEDRNDSVD